MSEREARDAALARVRGAVGSHGGASTWVERDGVRLHSLVFGSGPLDVVVLPGITSPAPTWAFVAGWLGDLARVTVLDIRGRGLSDAPDAGYQLADYVDDAIAVCEQLGIAEPVVLGHSMGARIGAAMGAARPGFASAYILLDPPLSAPGRSYPTSWESFAQQLDEGIAGTTLEAVRAFYPRWAEAELQIRIDWLPTCFPPAIRETYDAFEVDLFETSWDALVDTATFVYGTASPVVTAADLARIRDLQPMATLIGVEGAGHMIPWDEPEAARIVLRSLVQPLSAARAAASPRGGPS
ncbi:MAG: alpha/beta fold hydrolase [Gaiellales bacterium]